MPEKYPTVSVITVNHNGKPLLKDCFDSLFSVEYPDKNLEVIMVDNCSQDGSVEYVRKNYKGVKVIKNEVNNYCMANNTGIKQSSGKFIALLNNDTRIDRNWLKELMGVMVSADDVGAVGSKILFKDGRINTVGHSDLPNFYWADKGFKEEDKGQYDKIKEVNSVCGVSTLYRRSALENTGYFDEIFNMYVEDIDMGIRLKKMGWKILYCPSSVVYHKFHGTADEKTVKFYVERNRLLLIAKHFPEKLGDALMGSGYFTVLNERRNGSDIYSVLPAVFSNLLKYHDPGKLDQILPDLISNLRKILNLEKHYLSQALDNEKSQIETRELADKDALIQQKELSIAEKDEQLRQANENFQKLSSELQVKTREIIDKEKHLWKYTEYLQEISHKSQLKSQELAQKNAVIEQKDAFLAERDSRLKQADENMQKFLAEHEFKIQELKNKDIVIQEKNIVLNDKDEQIRQLNENIQKLASDLQLKVQEIANKGLLLQLKDANLHEKSEHLKQYAENFNKLISELQLKTHEIASKDLLVQQKDVNLNEKSVQLKQANENLRSLDQQLQMKSGEINIKNQEIQQKNILISEKDNFVNGLHEKLRIKELEVNAFYSSQTFRFIVRPVWVILNNLKKIRKILFFKIKPPINVNNRIIISLVQLFKLVFIKRKIVLCCSVFLAQAPAAKYKNANEYLLRITSNAPEDREAKISIITGCYEKQNPGGVFYSSFDKKILFKAMKPADIIINYDWAVNAEFIIKGKKYRPDNFRGADSAPSFQIYSIKAVLRGNKGRMYDSAQLFQVLKNENS